MLATPSQAHAEWHWNTGTPMGTPGCPQDACHPPDDDYEWAEEEARLLVEEPPNTSAWGHLETGCEAHDGECADNWGAGVEVPF